ncbi:Crp/Fnr family transcriptional regulator [Sphingobacteriaceae bacterium]|nr:Crp/Fnr family transcriptional regulator [Sphingobacteriaceae bacterium]
MEFNLEKYHLKSLSFFDLLSEEELAKIKVTAQRKEFTKGEYLFKENTFSKGIYSIRKGKVKIFQTNSVGKQSVVYIYKKGEFFGYRPLLAEEPHPVSGVAMDNVVITFIPKDIFLEILNASPGLARRLLQNLTKEFTVWVNKLTVFSQYGVKERVALSLLILKRIYTVTEEKGKVVVISITRDDFAGFVGTAKETLVRMLRIFKDEKIISTRGTKITILKHKTLLNMLSEL